MPSITKYGQPLKESGKEAWHSPSQPPQTQLACLDLRLQTSRNVNEWASVSDPRQHMMSCVVAPFILPCLALTGCYPFTSSPGFCGFPGSCGVWTLEFGFLVLRIPFILFGTNSASLPGCGDLSDLRNGAHILLRLWPPH